MLKYALISAGVVKVASRNLAAGRRRGSGATLPSFILTSRPFIASEVDGGGEEYFQGSKKPVWDELPPNSQVGWRGEALGFVKWSKLK